MFTRARTSTLALLAMSMPAFADVTPVEVWQSWIDYYKANGYTVTEGARDEAGETLTLKDVSIAYKVADEGAFTMVVPQIVLTSTGDGKVRTTLSDTATATGTFKDGEGKTSDIKFSATMPGAEVISSGAAKDMTHETKLPTVTLKLDEVKSETETLKDVAALTLADTAYTQHIVTTDKTAFDYTMTGGKVDLTVAVAGKDETGKATDVKLAGAFESIESKGKGVLPGVDMTKELNTALKAGLDIAGDFKMGPGNVKVDVTETDEAGQPKPMKISMDSKGLTGSVGLSAAGLSYQIDQDGVTAEATVPDMPFPIKYALESGSFVLQLPIMKSDTPSPFKMAYSLNGLTLGDEIWALFDAEKKLPRDPANMELDVTGLAKVAADLFDPEALKAVEQEAAKEAGAEPATDPEQAADMAEAGADAGAADATAEAGTDATAEAGAEVTAADTPAEPMPFEPTEVTINRFALNAVGAKIEASGSLKAPEGGSIEEPVGALKARYEGVNGLMDKLVAMGVMTAEDVQGYRMMLAMFAKPGEGEDVLTTDVEFKEGGSIFANGQQVK